MIVITKPVPPSGVRTVLLRAKARTAFGARYVDCNEHEADARRFVRLYLHDGKADATFADAGADADQFAALLVAHDPTALTDEEQARQRMATLRGKAKSAALTPVEIQEALKLILARLA